MIVLLIKVKHKSTLSSSKLVIFLMMLFLCPPHLFVLLSFSTCVTNPNAGSHHCWEWSPSVRMFFCSSSEAASSFSVFPDFCSVSPVAAHPSGEVAVVVLVVIHDKSRQEPEGHGGDAMGAALCSKRQRFGCFRANPEDEDDAGWATEPLSDKTVPLHKTKKAGLNLIPLKPLTRLL